MLHAFLVFAQDQAAKQDGPPIWATFMPLIVIFALFYFLLILPEKRREKRQREDLFSRLKKNDRVVTNAGIHGLISNVKDTTVIVKVADNVKIGESGKALAHGFPRFADDLAWWIEAAKAQRARKPPPY